MGKFLLKTLLNSAKKWCKTLIQLITVFLFLFLVAYKELKRAKWQCLLVDFSWTFIYVKSQKMVGVCSVICSKNCSLILASNSINAWNGRYGQVFNWCKLIMIGYVRAGRDNVEAMGTGLSALVNCIHITVWVEATIWEWAWSKFNHIPETELYIWKRGSCERKGEFEMDGLYYF